MKLESGKNKIKELVRILGLKTIFALLAILIFGIAVAEGGWVTPVSYTHLTLPTTPYV